VFVGGRRDEFRRAMLMARNSARCYKRRSAIVERLAPRMILKWYLPERHHAPRNSITR